MNESIRVLFISGSEEDTNKTRSEIEKCGYFVASERVSTCEELVHMYKAQEWDLIVSEFATDKFSFTEAISLIPGILDEIPFIVIYKDENEAQMLETIDNECGDYVMKGDFTRLRLSVKRITKKIAECRSNKQIMRGCLADSKFLLNSLDSIGDGVIIADRKGSIIMLNKAAQTYTGWSKSEALGKPIATVFNIVDKISRFPAESPFDKVMREGKVTGLKSNTVLISRDLNERYVSASCAPISIEYNEIEGIILVFRDITRIRQIENEVLNEQKNLIAIFEFAPIGMLLLDRNASIKRANAAIYRIAGREPIKEITNLKIGDIFRCPNRNTCTEGCGYCDKCKDCGLSTALNEACSSENPICDSDIQYMIFINEDNRKLWLRINSVPIIINQERHTLVIIDDITGLKQLQEEFKESNLELKNTLEELKMTQNHMIQQEKLAGIGQLAAGVAHEINNPLGFVMSNFETLKQYMERFIKILESYRELKNVLVKLINIVDDGDLSCLSIEYLKRSFSTIEKMLRKLDNLEIKGNIDYILGDMVDLFRDTNEGLSRIGKIVASLRIFSRVDQQNELAEYDLNEGIRSTLIVAQNEIKYYADVIEELQDIPIVKVNGGQINQVILNLIVNAVHAIKSKGMEERGLIRISTSCDNKFIYCCIEDNGIGIEEENLNKIFNPFFTTKSVGAGTGLGLSISYDIITNKHGGELLVKSVKGVGSSFTFKLPLQADRNIMLNAN